ncbi:MAG: nucleoside-diphosphate kinase [Candidatus Altiarchaeota archaeon]|nr:nucleoside-diphosphate kinase [Candidatus Altiarchaeota archaeon]
MERTFIMIKPDAVMRGLIGKIIGKFEAVGLKLVGLKMTQADEAKVTGFYPSDDGWLKTVGDKSKKGYEKLGIDIKAEMGTDDPIEIGKTVKNWLIKYISKGPSVALVFEGNRAAEMGRQIVGFTEPFSALPGTIRGDLAVDSFELANRDFRSLFNVIHASGNADEAKGEIKYWFSDNELFNYKTGTEMVLDFIKKS